MKKISYLFLLIAFLTSASAFAWPGMPMPKLHVEGRWLVDEDGNHVNLHGFGQTYSPWFNEMGSKWSNYDVQACLKYNKGIIDGILDRAGWKMTYIRMHMDPYWSNTPGMHTDGEHDISAFSMRRFQQYLKEVFIPMAEYAVSKGLYVVMRPPGVCPHTIAVNDDYHNYLKKVWTYVARQEALTKNPHIMFELANEPVDVTGDDKALSQFFQAIVDAMRNEGCENILWVPGSGYQSNYAGYAQYPIKGENIGYAVHVYPGWYGSDAIEPSHELGGSYGGGYSSFAAGWAAQIEPCAAIAPMLVTEMDWLPSKYKASWGKSITGKMLGAGFGANFKLLADRTGNVGWMLFTGPELLARFDGVPGSDNYYTMYNDPEGCMWSAYHWFNEYAGEELPEIRSVGLYLSPRSDELADEIFLQTGAITGAALIADRGIGVDFNVQGDIDFEFSNPGIVKWDNGILTAVKPGETDCTVSCDINGEPFSKDIHFISDPFPMKKEFFNPSYWDKGTFDEETQVFTTGQYGFACWTFGAGLDLSDYNYLIADIESADKPGTKPGGNLTFRVFDLNNYWDGDNHSVEGKFISNTRIVIDLKNMVSKNKVKLDPSHLYIVGFWSLGGTKYKLNKVFAANDMNADSSVEEVAVGERIVDVYNLQGVRVRKAVAESEAATGLPAGIYVIGGKKVLVK